MTWPTYRKRYLPAMALRQIEQMTDKENAFVVLPVGAIEQHGPHLPVAVDAMLGQVYLDHALPKIPEDAPVFIAPPIQIAKSNEHDGFPGSLILSRETLRQQMLSVGRQIHAWGFRRIGVLNTHGGNVSVVKSTLRELHLQLDIEVEILSFPYEADLPERERAYGIHANEVETSLMLAATPEMVDASASPTCWIGSLDDPKQLRSEFAPATYAWKSLDISPSGVMGDAKAGTAEKGALWIERAAHALAARLIEVVKKKW